MARGAEIASSNRVKADEASMKLQAREEAEPVLRNREVEYFIPTVMQFEVQQALQCRKAT